MDCEMCGNEREKMFTLYTWHNTDSDLCVDCYKYTMYRFRHQLKKLVSDDSKPIEFDASLVEDLFKRVENNEANEKEEGVCEAGANSLHTDECRSKKMARKWEK